VSAAIAHREDARPGVPLSLEHQAEIDALLAPLRAGPGRDCLSDLAFSNLYLFRHAHDYRYLPGPYPCVAGLTYDGVRHLMPLFDLSRAPPHAVGQMLDHADCFYPVTAATALRLDTDRYQLSSSDDDADYLYPADNFRFYRGALLRKKRNLMRQLLGATPVRAQPVSAACMDDALAVLAEWMRDKGKGAGQADEAACREALLLSERLGLDGTLYHAGDRPIGFLLAQPLARDMAVMRFAKGVDAYKGIYQYMFHHYCTRAAGIAWINFEQDLGLPNFRQTKRSYQPAALLCKFRVRLRGSGNLPSAT
jgi:hypothetical protein